MTIQSARQADRPVDYARLDPREAPHQAVGRRHPHRHRRAQPGVVVASTRDLDDGTGLCMISATKDGTRPHQPLGPQIEDSTSPCPTVRAWCGPGIPRLEEFSASKDGCDVRMGDCRFTGDLHEYRVTGHAEELSADIRLEGITEPWRPESGLLLFGPKDEHFFGWTPFVPFGKVTATYKIGDEIHEATGRGYHYYHNWTNTDLGHLIDHWWWARGEVGPYTFLAAHIVATRSTATRRSTGHAGSRRQGHRG